MKLVLAFMLICCIQLGASKVFTNEMSIGQVRRGKGWIFLDRMSFDEGMGYIKFTISIDTSTQVNREVFPLKLVMIPEESWMEEQTLQCGVERYGSNTVIMETFLKREDSYRTTVTNEFRIPKPMTYHFVLKDCEKTIGNEGFKKETKLIFSLEMKNSGQEHGADEHMNKFLLPFLLILTIGMVYLSRNGKESEDAGVERDWAKLLLHITLIINLASIAFYYLGFFIYTMGGTFYGFFDFVYLFFHSVSESVLACLLIFIAYGWTITFTKDAEFDLYIPIMVMLGIINMILTLLGKINDGEADKYHMYDTIPSYLLIFFRVITLCVFVGGIIKVSLGNLKNTQMIHFLIRFGVMGALYFLTLPAVVFLATFLSPSSRKQIVFFIVELVKNVINLLIIFMISSKNSKYTSIKQGSQSFFQSGNKLL